MYLAILVGVMLVWLLMKAKGASNNPYVIVGNYKATHFPLSGGMSLEVIQKMREDGLPQYSLEEFASMEDEFLRLEKETVCSGLSYKVPAIEMSRKIKSRFPKYDFRYHNLHIKQVSEPSKAINPWITCRSEIPMSIT